MVGCRSAQTGESEMVLLFQNQPVLDYGETENKKASQTVVLNEAPERWWAPVATQPNAGWRTNPLANGMFTNIEHTLCN